MNSYTRIGGIVCCAAGLLLMSQPVHAADKVTADQLLPANTFALISIPDVTQLKEQFNESTYGGMRDDEALRPFWADVDAAWENMGEQVERQIGIGMDELLDVPSGEASIAVVPVRGNRIGVLGVLDFGDSEETVDALLEKLADAMEDQGATRKIEEVEDTRIVVYTFPQDEEVDEDQPRRQQPANQFAYFVRDELFVAGSDLSVLQDALKRWDGETQKTLSESDVYSYVREQTKAGDVEPVLAWYVDPIGLTRAAVTMGAQGNPQVGLAFAFLPALGLDRFKAMGGSFSMGVDEFETVSRTLLYVEQPARGVLNIFQFPAADLTPPAWVAADTDAYFAANWDVTTAYQAIENLYDNFPGFGKGPGGFAELMDQLAEQDPSIHPKKDVVDLLTGRMMVIGKTSAEVDDDEIEADASYIFAAGIKDPAKANALLAKIAQADTGLETREFEGVTIYEVATPGAGGGLATASVAVAQGNLLVTNQPTLLEQLLRKNNDIEPLAQSDEYKLVAAHYPAKASMLSFERQDAQIEAAYEMLRSGQVPVETEDIDFGKLPEFDEVRKYLPMSGSYTVPDKNGALFVGFTLTRDEE